LELASPEQLAVEAALELAPPERFAAAEPALKAVQALRFPFLGVQDAPLAFAPEHFLPAHFAREHDAPPASCFRH